MDSPADNAPFVIDPSGNDPLGEAERIRALGPAARVELPGAVQAWAISDQGLLRRLLADPRVSRDAYQHWPAWIKGEIRSDWPLLAWVADRSIFTAYGPGHQRLRGLVADSFTARRVAALRPRIEEIACDLLSGLADLPPDRPVDLRERYTYQLPVKVICELFGVGDEATPAEVSRCADALFNIGEAPEETAAAFRRLRQIFRNLLAEKRERPGDDLSSALIAARDGDTPPLSEEELVDVLWGFVSASLRHQAPVPNMPLRYAVEDIDLGDGLTPGGSTSPARSRITWPSATACITASARRWPGWRPRSRCRRSLSVIRIWPWPSSPVSCCRLNPSSQTGTTRCPPGSRP
jgi:cytochrome P450